MEANYDGVIEVECPYKNCGAGKGMECVVHKRDGSRPTRDEPHAARVRAAEENGLLEQTDEEAALVAELEAEINATD